MRSPTKSTADLHGSRGTIIINGLPRTADEQSPALPHRSLKTWCCTAALNLPNMELESLSTWLIDMLQRRQIKPDGRLLFAYDLSLEEYQELGRELSEAIAAAGGMKSLAELSLGRSRLVAPSAAFVLYASEWWKHEYAGGVWDWAPIIKSLGGDPDSFSSAQQLRSAFVARGLAFWQLRPLDAGKRFIGSIVVNGGIPMRLLADGDGPVALVLSQVLKQAGRYRWGHAQTLGAVSERLIHLPAAYRRPEISELLAQFVDAALQLKDEYQLEGLTDPVARLDGVLLDWRHRFPVSLESQAAQSLLSGLVKEAATQGAGYAHGLFVAERRLVRDPVSGLFSIESHVSHPNRIAAKHLGNMFGLNQTQEGGAEDMPRYFSIDIEAETRQPCTEGRLVLGAEEPVAVLTARKLVIRNQAARSELQLIMRSPTGDKGERYTLEGGGAMPDEDPWIFVEGEAGYPVLAAGGGARLPHESAWVALPPGWSVECNTETEAVGELLCPGLPLRKILCLRSDARLLLSGVAYRVRLGQIAQHGQIYQWKAQRLPEARGRSVFRDRHPPRLFRTTDEGLQAVPQSDQQWRRAGTQEQLFHKATTGPVEVRILDQGELVARQRIFVLSHEARIEYISGNVIGTGQVRFVNWGPVDLSPEVAAGVNASVSRDGVTSINIDLSSVGAPPSEFRVRVRWSGTFSELSLTLPYPVTGGRFLRSNGSVMQAHETVTLSELVGMRLQIFDTNPNHPKRYEIQLALGKGNRQVSSRYPVRLLLGVGRAEVRLLDYQKQIESLLGLFDDLDAQVRVGLVVGGACTSEISVGRYTTTLQMDKDSVRVPATALGRISAEGLENTRVFANSLIQPGVSPLELVPVRTEGVHTGAWAAQGMTPELAPWLVYPAKGSAVQFRPLVWVETRSQAEDDVSSSQASSTGEVVSLPDAMLQTKADERRQWIHSALQGMSENHLHDSWPLLDSLWQTFHHLPLTALDVWRMLAKQPKAMLSFLLRSELDEAELAEALRRFRIETGWVPELTTVSDLCEVSQSFWKFWVGQNLNPDRCKKYFKEEIESRFKLLANEVPSLRPLIETVVFAATGTVSELLLEVAGPSKKPTATLLKQLWDGGDSLVNSQLLLVNESQEIWPCRDFVEKHALPVFLKNCPPDQAVKPYLEQIFWKFDSWAKYFGTQFNKSHQPDFKFSVVNLPVLCALWAATSTSRQWWGDPRSRLALKQIRDFDPIWFEQAYRQAFKVCMSIDGLVQLPAITDH